MVAILITAYCILENHFEVSIVFSLQKNDHMEIMHILFSLIEWFHNVEQFQNIILHIVNIYSFTCQQQLMSH